MEDLQSYMHAISFPGNAHESSALEGQTEAPDINVKTNLHFVAFVHCDGGLYEMDGRLDKPVRHGNTTPDTLLEVIPMRPS